MGIMLVYDVTDGKSFDSIGKWLRNIDEVLKFFIYLFLIYKYIILLNK